jgi:hypothetical protein
VGFFNSVLQALLGNGAAAVGSGGLTGFASGLSDTANALVAFFTTITDYRMWRSLGWLLLGAGMITAGLLLLAKDAALGSVARAVRGS